MVLHICEMEFVYHMAVNVCTQCALLQGPQQKTSSSQLNSRIFASICSATELTRLHDHMIKCYHAQKLQLHSVNWLTQLAQYLRHKYLDTCQLVSFHIRVLCCMGHVLWHHAGVSLLGRTAYLIEQLPRA